MIIVGYNASWRRGAYLFSAICCGVTMKQVSHTPPVSHCHVDPLTCHNDNALLRVIVCLSMGSYILHVSGTHCCCVLQLVPSVPSIERT